MDIPASIGLPPSAPRGSDFFHDMRAVRALSKWRWAAGSAGGPRMAQPYFFASLCSCQSVQREPEMNIEEKNPANMPTRSGKEKVRIELTL